MRDSAEDQRPALGSIGPDGGQLVAAVLAGVPDVTVFVAGPDLRFRYVAGAALCRLGWTEAEIVGRRPSELLGPDDGGPVEDHLRAALAGAIRHHEHPGIRDPRRVWTSTVAPLTAADGSVTAAVVVARDTGEVRRARAARDRWAEEAQASAVALASERRQRRRLQFLAEINEVIAACPDRRAVMEAVTRAAVPRLGDWCVMHVLMDPHDPEPAVAVAHVDPELAELARRLQHQLLADQGRRGLAGVVGADRPSFQPRITEVELAEARLPPELERAARELQVRAAITVPLRQGAAAVGAMQFVLAGPERDYGQDDVTLAEAVAGRVASALENCRLAEQQRDIARTLQRSLLPGSLPEVPGATLAVRYWAAGEGSEVGGDFYDVFELDDGSHALVVGDVCGSGPDAAAVTALARHSLRASAWHGDEPVEVLRHLNRALLRTRPDTLCTVAYATVAQVAGGLRLVAAAAGHPPPVRAGVDGAVAALGRPGHLLGVLDEVALEATEVVIGPGETVVWFTDGAYDLPPPHGMSLDDLAALIGQAAHQAADAEAVADRLAQVLERRRAFSQRHDDIVVVVLRAS